MIVKHLKKKSIIVQKKSNQQNVDRFQTHKRLTIKKLKQEIRLQLETANNKFTATLPPIPL